jgi:hypothetical protein
MKLCVNRPSGLFLCKYLANKEQIFDINKGELKARKLRKVERYLINTISNVCNVEQASLRVEKFGASFVILNKAIPIVLVPMGIYNQHTKDEILYVPWLETIIKAFTPRK